MGMMKRTRVDEVQYGSRANAGVGGGGGGVGLTTHHRISQHPGAQTIQYQLSSTPTAVLKSAATVPDSGSAVTSGGVQSQTVQYSSYNVTQVSGMKSQSQNVAVPDSSGPTTIGGAGSSVHVTNVTITPSTIRHRGTPTSGNQNVNQQVVAPAVPTTVGAPPPRLKVEDALSYLDQVKYQYADQPQIYNNFLDIMKEFKSQCIDTPGVIQRVSNLFKGHTELIYGFNMFLPPGYKIEIQANEQGISVPVVSMPSPPSGGGPIIAQCLNAQSSPVHKSTPNPASGVVHQIQSGAFNLMTHPSPVGAGTGSLPSSIHSLPPPAQQPSPAAAATATQVVQTPAIPQNYSRDRERSVSQSGSIVGAGPPTPNSLSEMSPQGHNLHHISQAHQIMMGETGGQQNQPVEFNHAITYVNKIKNRFQSQPEKYKRFLEILHTYQKEQKVMKEGSIQPGKTLTEAEVYTQVAKLFDQQDDLLQEFGQFLPDATNHQTTQYMNKAHNDHKKMSFSKSLAAGGTPLLVQGIINSNNLQNNLSRMDRDHFDKDYHLPREKERNHLNQKFGHNVSQSSKKSPSYSSMSSSHMPRRNDDSGAPPTKRHKPICRDITLSEARGYGELADAAFFDQVRKALRNMEVYHNFLRCLTLFNQEIISKSELLNLVSPFLNRFPELHRKFQDFMAPMAGIVSEGIPLASAQRQDRNQGGELAQEIDLSSCKRLGASYCALPHRTEPKKCSGRTTLCREVLNDTWVSFPTWASEDSTFVTSRKTQFEEIIYRTEDERFELDVVIETNSSTIRVLEGVQKKMSRMSQEDVQRFRLDECLGGNSPTIHQRALRRIYGDKAPDIIQGLKKNPVVAVPVVLRRLKAKEEEWREAQKNFNKTWREQNEKYYLKSLDHQAINFKPNDIKALRSKNLFNEIETLYFERNEQNDESSDSISSPHLILPYKDKTILDDAANLLIHHVKRQTGIQKQEKTKIKHILRQFVPDLFFSPRQPLSDDERDDDDNEKLEADPSDTESVKMKSSTRTSIKVEDTRDISTTSINCIDKSVSSSSIATPFITASTTIATSSTSSTSSGASPPSDKSESNFADSRTSALQSCKKDSFNNNTSNTIIGNSIINNNKLLSSTNTSLSVSSSCAQTTNSINSDNHKVISSLTTASGTTIKLVDSNSKCDTIGGNNNNTSSSSTSKATQLQSGPSNVDEDGDIKMEIKEEVDDLNIISTPLPPHAISKHMDETYTLCFSNNNWYLFFRLHAILCERLRTMYERAQILASEEVKFRTNRSDSTATALRLKPKSEIQVEDYYPTFLDMLKNVLDGNMDSNTYEDSMREMFGIHAYISFTLDRVVSNAVRQLQHCVTERSALDCVELFHSEQRKGGAGGLCRSANKRAAAELSYQRKAEASLQDENCFKVYIYKIDCRVTIELLDTESDDVEKTTASTKAWSQYVDTIKNPVTGGSSGNHSSSSGSNNRSGGAVDANNMEIKTERNEDEMNSTFLPRKPLFLSRNIRKSKNLVDMAMKAALITNNSGSANNQSTECIISTTEEISTKTSSLETLTATTAAIGSSTTISSSSSLQVTDKIVNNGNQSGLDVSDPFWNKRPPERLGTGANDKYIIDDREEVKITMQNYKMFFVFSKNVSIFKRNSLRRAKQTHSKVTRDMQMRFQTFTTKWLDKNVNDLQRLSCNDWLLGKSPDLAANDTVIIQENDVRKTPYRKYNRYRVNRMDS